MNNNNSDNFLYSGVATYGRIRSFLGAIIATLVFVIFFSFAIYLFYKGNTFTDKYSTQAIITSSQCNQTSCNITYTYSLKNGNTDELFQGTATIKMMKKVGDVIVVYYDPKDHSQSQLTQDNNYVNGTICLVLALLVLIFSWVTFYLTTRYKAFAAVEGGVGIFNML